MIRSNRAKRVYKGDSVALYLPEGFKPTEIGIKNLYRSYHSGSAVYELDITDKVRKTNYKKVGLMQKLERQDEINALTARQYMMEKYEKEKPKGLDISLGELYYIYNKTAKKQLTLAQFRTKAKRRSFQKTLRQLATHQFS